MYISYFPGLQQMHMEKVRSVKEALEGECHCRKHIPYFEVHAFGLLLMLTAECLDAGITTCGGTSTGQSENDMAESITKAFAFILCVCRAYKESAQCRLEATFACDMGIPIFFVVCFRMQDEPC